MKYRVAKDGAIVDKYNAVLYESFCTNDLSIAAKKRLAEIHSNDEEIDWEGAAEILVSEGLLRADWSPHTFSEIAARR